MDVFIDRRDYNTREIAINRKKFIERTQTRILNYLSENLQAISINNNICDIELNNISIVSEPEFRYELNDGVYNYICCHNDFYRVGDELPKPEGPNQLANQPGFDGGDDTEDEFSLTSEEIQDLLLGDLKLPDLQQKRNAHKEKIIHKGGYTKNGNPCKLDIKKSFKESLLRRNALIAGLEKRIKEIEAEIQAMECLYGLCLETWPDDVRAKAEMLIREKLELQTTVPPVFEQNDLRYKTEFIEERPVTSAVLFLMMDVSGSMDYSKKTLARIGAYALKLLLLQNYKDLEIVFIRHHIEAEICTEFEFFNVSSTGGTMISSSLEIMKEQIRTKYHEDKYNIYALQLTDGENHEYDNPKVVEMIKELLPKVQLYGFISLMPNVKWGRELAILLKQQFFGSNRYTNMVMHDILRIRDWKRFFRDTFKDE